MATGAMAAFFTMLKEGVTGMLGVLTEVFKWLLTEDIMPYFVLGLVILIVSFSIGLIKRITSN